MTIGLAVRNGERFLGPTIETLLGQTFTDFELVVGNNCSTDGTRAIVEAAAARDRRVRYLGAERNGGLAWNHNRLVDSARGEYFMWAAYDDLFAPIYLERCVEVLDSDSSIAYVLATNVLIDECDEVLGVEVNRFRVDDPSPSRRFWELLVVQGGHNAYGLTRTELIQRVKPHPTVPRGERILYAELSLLGPFRVLQEPLYFRRIHSSQATNSRVRRSDEAQILDPNRATWWRHQTPILVGGYLLGFADAIVRSPIPLSEKLKAAARLTRWGIGHAPGARIRDARAHAVEVTAELRGSSVRDFMGI